MIGVYTIKVKNIVVQKDNNNKTKGMAAAEALEAKGGAEEDSSSSDDEGVVPGRNKRQRLLRGLRRLPPLTAAQLLELPVFQWVISWQPSTAAPAELASEIYRTKAAVKTILDYMAQDSPVHEYFTPGRWPSAESKVTLALMSPTARFPWIHLIEEVPELVLKLAPDRRLQLVTKIGGVVDVLVRVRSTKILAILQQMEEYEIQQIQARRALALEAREGIGIHDVVGEVVAFLPYNKITKGSRRRMSVPAQRF